MIHRLRKQKRPGGVMLEAALVYPVLAMFLIGTLMLGLGVCAFQQVASLSREGARWASVHGATFATTTKQAMATKADVYTTAILPMAAAIDTAQLTYDVTWSDAGHVPNATNPSKSTVTVTVIYQWYPAAYLAGPITLTSISVMPMSF
jgi:Flp pilus assembly protein TadG